jgi:hypothetical protein
MPIRLGGGVAAWVWTCGGCIHVHVGRSGLTRHDPTKVQHIKVRHTKAYI